MTTRLHRRPFLMPLWLFAMMALAGFLVLVSAAWIVLTADSTEIVVVRHAESAQGGAADPPLSPQGLERAALLARMFGDPRQPGTISAIYVSATQCDRLTAAPLAARLGLTPTVVTDTDPKALARRVVREHAGGRILVIGPGDTVAALVAALSRSKHIPAPDAADYGTMYIVTTPRIGHANVLRLSY